MPSRPYAAHAIHSSDTPGQSRVAGLGVVRWDLPEDDPSGGRRRERAEASDRLLGTLEEVRAFSTAHGGPRPYRVEHLTAPRREGRRLVAMSVYLLYVDPTHHGPTHCVLEAGVATGRARVCFPACEIGRWQTVDVVPGGAAGRTSLRGRFEVRPEASDEPDQLVVEAYRHPADRAPSLRVQIDYANAVARAMPRLGAAAFLRGPTLAPRVTVTRVGGSPTAWS